MVCLMFNCKKSDWRVSNLVMIWCAGCWARNNTYQLIVNKKSNKCLVCMKDKATILHYKAIPCKANEINFDMNHAQGAGLFVWPVDLQSSMLPLCYGRTWICIKWCIAYPAFLSIYMVKSTGKPINVHRTTFLHKEIFLGLYLWS